MQYIDAKYDLLINGEWVPAEGGETFETFNPANGEKLADCANASPADIDRAVSAARAAFPAWAAKSPQERAALLLKIADLIDENAARLAMVETLDNGKPIRETTLVDVPLSSDHFRYFAGCLRAEEGSAVMIDQNTMSLVLHEPIGVVGQIIPWNFPLLMGAWKIAPALAAGNTLVIKSSSTTPLSLFELGKLLNQVLPAGVVNIVSGRGARTGQAMLDHPGFDKLAFTGSTEVGYSVAEAAAKRLIPSTLELGGQVRQHHLRRRPARQGDRRRPDRHSLQSGPGLLRGLAHLRSGRHLRQVRERACRSLQENQGGRSDGHVDPDGRADQRASALQDPRLRRRRRQGRRARSRGRQARLATRAPSCSRRSSSTSATT